jgi:hypothetical protein
VMNLCRRGKRAVDGGHGSTRAHAAPFIADGDVDGDDAISKRGHDRFEPSLQCVGLARITSASSMRRRISPGTSALKKRSPSSTVAYHAATFGSHRAALRISAMTLVSMRKLIDQRTDRGSSGDRYQLRQ